jgi:nucleobase:cation symporter-1, NCS1 family
VRSPHWIGALVLGVATTSIAIVGYRLIHVMSRINSVVGTVALMYVFYHLLDTADIGALLTQRSFSMPKFALAVPLSASWQTAYGPNVADYSHYLPDETPAWKPLGASLSGSVLSSQASTTFGVFAAALGGSSFSGHEVDYVVNLGGTA